MALNFPDSPSDGDTFEGFKYNSSKGVWNSAKLAPVSAVTVYANLAAFPSSGNTVGDYAFATDTKAVYIWDGTEWDRVSTDNNETPRLTTTPASTHSLNTDGTNTAITIVASDPEGFPITYSHDTNPASPNQVTNIVNNNGVFTLVPSTNQAHGGNFTLRLKASDGISTTSHAIAVGLSFTESMHVPAGTTLLLGLSFDGGTLNKTGSWGTPSGGTRTYNTSGGVLNGGYASNISGSLTVSELANAGSGAGKTFIAWYKGSQTNGINVWYAPAVPLFSHDTNAVHMGFGLEDGKIVVCGTNPASQGSTNLATNTWRMLAFTYSASGHIINGYCDNGSGTMTREITDADTSANAAHNRVNHFFNAYNISGYAQPDAVDNVQVFDNVLTLSQIQAIFDKGGGTNGGN